MTSLLRITGLSGFFLFGALLASILTMPSAFERSALSFVKAEVTSEVLDRYPDLADGPIEDAVNEGLGRLSMQLGRRQSDLAALAASSYPEVLGKIIEEFCTCGAIQAEDATARIVAVRAGLEARAAALGLDQTRIVEFMRHQYDETVDSLRTDLTIFLSVNALAFAAVFGTTFVSRGRRHAVIVPAALLVVATMLCAAIYVLGTDWFYAILFRDYAGWWYGLGLAVVFVFLADIVANRARATLYLLSFLPSALAVSPC